MNYLIQHKINYSSIKGFDIRLVPYEEIHNILDKDFEKLVQIIAPQDNDIILDAGAGYGAVTREILSRTKSSIKNLNVYLLDISTIQLEKARENLKTQLRLCKNDVQLNFIHDSIVHPDFDELFFDKVVCKMVVHEISHKYQQSAINEIFRILKNNGKLILWDLMLNHESRQFFQNIIRKKDELAGYCYLVKNRYFLREDELITLLKDAGFSSIKKEIDVTYELHTKTRMKYELDNNLNKLNCWNDFIRNEAQKLSYETLRTLNFIDNGDDIVFTPPKSIYSALKNS